MTLLVDTLAEKNREAVLAAKLVVAVDAMATDDDVTYSVRLEGPSFSEVILAGQTDVEVATAMTEFAAWAVALW